MWRETLNQGVQKQKYTSEVVQAWTQIIHERPQVEGFLARSGSLSLQDYGKSVVATPSRIQPVVSEVIQKITSRLFSDKVVKGVERTLSAVGNIDTSSHGGIISEDTLVQSQVVLAEGIAQFGLDTMVSLACGAVPMNNSTWPRGFFRRGRRESIFPKSFDRTAVHEAPCFTKADIAKKLAQSADTCTKEILTFIDEIPNIYEVTAYTDQAQLINYNLWNKCFSGSHVKNYVHLPLETVTAELICRSIEADDAIAQLFFCAQHRDILMETLANLPGTWSLDKSKGTFLFWHRSGDFRAASLWPDADKLIGAKTQINFSPESICRALRAGEIVPSVFSSLVTLLFYGVRPLGGYHQIAYLPEYAARLKTFSEKTKVSDCPVFTAQLDCADLIQLGYGFVFLKDEQSETGYAGIDHFFCNPITKETLLSLLDETSVSEALFLNTRRWYNEIIPVSQRKLF